MKNMINKVLFGALTLVFTGSAFAGVGQIGSANHLDQKASFLLVDRNNLNIVKVKDTSDAKNVCFKYIADGPSRECDGRTQADKLHKVQDDEGASYLAKGLTPNLAMTKFVDGKKKSILVRYSFMTEDGYIGFVQGPGYSWTSDSVFYDTTVNSNSTLVVSPKEMEKIEFSKEIQNHSSIGKSWRAGQSKFTVLSVFENGLAQVGESFCSKNICADGYFARIFLQKPAK